MNFSIITPSFRNGKWLPLCIASVADQAGVTLEHIVQDSCSDDGTGDWLPHDRRVKAFIEKDTGMYDAVNRGYQRAQGDLLAYINCDEQYLPGALKAVHDYFTAHLEIEVVLAHCVVVDTAGNYICHRPSLKPVRHCLWVRFPFLTCSLFLRREVITKRKILFDTKWRDLGDMFWIKDLVDSGVRMAVLPRFTSIFTETGENMNLKPNALREREEQAQLMPRWIKQVQPIIVLHHWLRLIASGTYFQKPFDYSLYTLASPERRVTIHVPKPTAIWRRS